MISKQEAITKLRQEGYHISKNRFSTNYLKSLNFKIKTLIDIGVNNGTPNLYAAFPKADMFLIDPQEISLENLELWQKDKYKITFINKALGSREDEIDFYISNISARSSILQRQDKRKNESFTSQKVSLTTLDTLDKQLDFKGDIGLKIDVEGYEHEVLKGCDKVLKRTEFVIVETSIIERFKDGAKFSDVVTLLSAQDIELFDILTPLISSPKSIDCLFVRKSNKLFSKKNN